MLPSPGTDLFTCGARVHMPTLRTPAAKGNSSPASEPCTPVGQRSSQAESCDPRRHRPTLKRRVTAELGQSLQFSDDVVSSRSPHTISYAKAKSSMKAIFLPSSLGLRTLPTTSEPVGRHDCRGEPKKHAPCHMRESPEGAHSRAGGLLPRRRRSLPSKLGSSAKTGGVALSRSSSYVCPNQEEAASGSKVVPSSSSVQWKEQTLHRLSSATARRFVEEFSQDRERERLEEILKRKHQRRASLEGLSKDQLLTQTSLPHTSGGSGMPTAKPDQPKWMKSGGSERDLQTDRFTVELQEGAKPVYQKGGDGRSIILDNNTSFNKVLQSSYPPQPFEWCHSESVPDAPPMGKTFVKGQQRWTDLPQPAKTPEDLQWICQGIDSPLPEKSPSLSKEEEEEEEEGERIETSTSRLERLENFDIIHEWMDKWHIHINLDDVSESNVAEGLHSLSDNSKMSAIASLALLAEQDQSNHLSGIQPPGSTLNDVAMKFVGELYRLLEDPVVHVRVPAAIVLHCLAKKSKQTEEVLLSSVDSSSVAEQWASVQCLAASGNSSSPVVTGLLSQLLRGSRDHRMRARAAELLARLSVRTSLVSAMLREKLNSTGWQDRLAACQLLPKLYQGINKDTCSKLVVLSWEDWSPEVRQAASQALGLSGNGKLIHDELQRRLADGTEMMKLDVLKKLQSLHLMTSQFLPPLLCCFSDDHVSIRIEATSLAGYLKLSEPQILHEVKKLLQDPCWKVKAHALKALGDIGAPDEDMVTKILWAMRFEKLPAVRAEACHAIAQLGVREERVEKALQDLLTIEEDPMVLREVSSSLHHLGLPAKREDEMLDTIREEVQRLGTAGAIKSAVRQLEKTIVTDYVIERPRALTSTRDYLNDKIRHKVYTKEVDPPTSHPTPVDELIHRHTDCSWEPDKTTIDRQLDSMRNRYTQPV